MLIKIDDLYVNPKAVQYVRLISRPMDDSSGYVEIGFSGNTVKLRASEPSKIEDVVATIKSALADQP